MLNAVLGFGNTLVNEPNILFALMDLKPGRKKMIGKRILRNIKNTRQCWVPKRNGSDYAQDSKLKRELISQKEGGAKLRDFKNKEWF